MVAVMPLADNMTQQTSSKISGTSKWPVRVAVIGVGLLGGSVAKAIRRRLPEVQLVAWARSHQKKEELSKEGTFDEVFDDIQEVAADCDVVVVASPVTHIARLVSEIGRHSPPDCLVTDVGSTKLSIVESIEKDSHVRSRFVAAHPIAGSEKTGIEHAQSDLFDQKWIILTPGSHVAPKWLEKARSFWSLTGGIVQEMSPKAHDTHLAAISHVPHLVSSLVAKIAPAEARTLAGSGWRDITRVAAGDPGMWTAICQENRGAISAELNRVRQELEQLQRILDTGDDAKLQAWLTEAQNIKKHQTTS